MIVTTTLASGFLKVRNLREIVYGKTKNDVAITATVVRNLLLETVRSGTDSNYKTLSKQN